MVATVLVLFMHGLLSCLPCMVPARSTLLLASSLSLHGPPTISSGPVHARSAILHALSPYRPRSCLPRLVLSLHGPRFCSPRPVPASAALLLASSCPCTVRALARLVLSLHGPPNISSGPVHARSVLLLALSYLCTVCRLARLVLSLYGLRSHLLGLSLPGTRSWLSDCHYMIRPAYRLVPSLHRPSGCSPGPVPAPSVCHLARLVLSLHGPPNISSGPVPAPSAQHLASSCPCTVRPTSHLVLSLHGPCTCLPVPVSVPSALLLAVDPVWSAILLGLALSLCRPRSCLAWYLPAGWLRRSVLLLALSCPCTVRAPARLVLSLHGPPNISSGPVYAWSLLSLALPCLCTSTPLLALHYPCLVHLLARPGADLHG